MNFTRTIAFSISEDLKEKMVLIGGPRQGGKAPLPMQFLTRDEQYFSWDDLEQRSILKKHQIDPQLSTIVLDEIHRYARWRTLLKGPYDKNKSNLKIMVTGSTRLDHFRKVGGSLTYACLKFD